MRIITAGPNVIKDEMHFAHGKVTNCTYFTGLEAVQLDLFCMNITKRT
jgi:hypothetical protein